MEAMINLLAKYFGIDPAILFAAVANVESTAPSSTSVYVGDNDGEYDESDDYASGVYVDDSDHDETNEHVNGVYVGHNDSDHDEPNEYVNGVYAADNDHDESNEYVNGVYVGDNDDNGHDDSSEYVSVVYGGSAVVRSSAGYSEISDDRNYQYRFELKGSELADGDLVDAG